MRRPSALRAGLAGVVLAALGSEAAVAQQAAPAPASAPTVTLLVQLDGTPTDAVVERTVTVLQRRLGELRSAGADGLLGSAVALLGGAAVTVRRVDADRVEVVVRPNEVERAKRIIATPAQLGLHLVTAVNVTPTDLPPDSLALPLVDQDVVYAVEPNPIVTDEDLLDAEAVETASGPAVMFRLDDEATGTFCAVTTAGVGLEIAIVLDGTIMSAPRVLTPICGGMGQITGSFDPEAAADLALMLRTGRLPVPLSIIDERATGAEQR